jgi:hypothetical protein
MALERYWYKRCHRNRRFLVDRLIHRRGYKSVDTLLGDHRRTVRNREDLARATDDETHADPIEAKACGQASGELCRRCREVGLRHNGCLPLQNRHGVDQRICLLCFNKRFHAALAAFHQKCIVPTAHPVHIPCAKCQVLGSCP